MRAELSSHDPETTFLKLAAIWHEDDPITRPALKVLAEKTGVNPSRVKCLYAMSYFRKKKRDAQLREHPEFFVGLDAMRIFPVYRGSKPKPRKYAPFLER